MRLTEHLALVGSGDTGGFSLSHPLDCHVYLIDGGAGELALVDAGAGQEIDLLFENIRAAGFAPEQIRWLLLTHAHFDHAGGAAVLRRRLDLKVIAGVRTAAILEKADMEANGMAPLQRAGLYPMDVRLEPCLVDKLVSDGLEFQIGAITLRAIATPGHSADHFAYLLLGEHPALFSGDALLAGGKVLLQALPDANLEDLQRTINRLNHLETAHAPQVIEMLLPAHGVICLKRAQRHLRAAQANLERFHIPDNAILD